jgi:hypothetical protein
MRNTWAPERRMRGIEGKERIFENGTNRKKIVRCDVLDDDDSCYCLSYSC